MEEVLVEEAKVHVPRVTLTESSIVAMEYLAERRGVVRSVCYQEAVDLYLAMQKHKDSFEKFKVFINDLL